MAYSLQPLKKTQRYVVFAVSLGNILEWYEIYLYIFWAPTISAFFFNQSSITINLFNTIAFFALGFVIRPLGGVFFGRLGDWVGRKKAFVLSILCMTIPTFCFGLLPDYSQIGILAPILLALIRILQTFPAGGELPGVFCYLYENANPENRKFMSSFAGFGNQIGIALSAIECFLLQKYLPVEIFNNWGWRISFILGGLIGLGGLYLRYKLHETKLFQEMVVHHRMVREPFCKVIRKNWKKIVTGIAYVAAQTSSFHIVTILLPVYFYKITGSSHFDELTIPISIFALTTIPLPIFGLLADRFGSKKLLVYSTSGMLLLLYPLYNSIHSSSIFYMSFVSSLFILSFTCITALLPYLLSNLFSTAERYTCVGLSFNISDGVLGGLSIIAGLYLFRITDDPGSFSLILLITCLISLVSFLKIKTD